MDNQLDNGTVLPNLLLSGTQDMMAGFNKSYKNFALRIGVVDKSYPTTHERNKSKLTTEYDILVIEQHEDRGATTIMYRNCMSAEGLGSVADFFEKALRPKKKKTTKGDSTNLKGQNGAIVLLLCLDGMSDKGIIISALTHPDRKTNLKDEGPYLEGEYNGVNVKVNKDGSTTLTFKGATDNDGNVIDKTQGNTVITIEKDGSYQVGHATATQRLDKNGKVSLSADDDISNTTKKNYNISATENVNISATKNFSLSSVDLLANATGSAIIKAEKISLTSDSEILMKSGKLKIEADSIANIKSTSIILDGFVSLGGQGGLPILLLTTLMIGIDNQGAPVLSMAVSGFANRVTGQ